jgi:hypothetical protein
MIKSEVLISLIGPYVHLPLKRDEIRVEGFLCEPEVNCACLSRKGAEMKVDEDHENKHVPSEPFMYVCMTFRGPECKAEL